ncbi:MAG: hypothetical protein HY704_06480 [Gemmatimonadetes bacterium]|nr:hypothetical protein [Gemmatimonadota bacterium]
MSDAVRGARAPTEGVPVLGRDGHVGRGTAVHKARGPACAGGAEARP